jgi:YVTN family beta-propeller protein
VPKYLKTNFPVFAILWILVALGPASQSHATAYAYVSNSFDNTVSVIRTSDNEVISNVAVGEWPYGVAISGDGEYVYVSNTGDDTLSVIRTCDHTVTATIKVGASPGGVFVSPYGPYVYTADNDDNTVSVIDTSSNRVIASVDVGLWPEGLVTTPDGEHLYVVNTGDGTVSVIQTSDLRAIETVEVGEWPYGVAVSPSGEHIYVSNTRDNTVSVIRTSDNTVVDTVNVAIRPIGIGVTPDGNYVYVAASRDNSVSVIRTSDNTVTATVEVGNWPWGLAVSPEGDYVYVSNIADDTVSVVRTTDNLATEVLAVGADPYSFGKFVSDISDEVEWVNTVTDGEQIGIKGKKNVTKIDSILSIDPNTIAVKIDKPERLPLGLLSFNLTVANPGDLAEVTIYLSKPAKSGDKWFKYDSVNGWQDYSAHSWFSADRRAVTLELKDGGYGDADGMANGLIVDPSGLGSSGESSTDSGGGGGGGCFIATVTCDLPQESHFMVLRKFLHRVFLTRPLILWLPRDRGNSEAKCI